MGDGPANIIFLMKAVGKRTKRGKFPVIGQWERVPSHLFLPRLSWMLFLFHWNPLHYLFQCFLTCHLHVSFNVSNRFLLYRPFSGIHNCYIFHLFFNVNSRPEKTLPLPDSFHLSCLWCLLLLKLIINRAVYINVCPTISWPTESSERVFFGSTFSYTFVLMLASSSTRIEMKRERMRIMLDVFCWWWWRWCRCCASTILSNHTIIITGHSYIFV